MKQLDAIIIGSGQGGTPLARKLANAGYRTALIEKRYIGGTCINDGCTPTKTMIASAAVAYTVRNSGQWGIETRDSSVDFTRVVQRKNEVVHSFRSSSEKSLQTTPGLELVFGEAVFTGDKTIAVHLTVGGIMQCTAPLIFINTGTRSAVPDIEGIDSVPFFDSTTLLDAATLPPALLVLGGGYVGLELGQMFHRLGSSVTIIDNNPVFLPHEDRDIAQCIQSILEQEGVRILSHTRVKKLQKNQAGDGILAIAEQDGSEIQLARWIPPAGRYRQGAADRSPRA